MKEVKDFKESGFHWVLIDISDTAIDTKAGKIIIPFQTLIKAMNKDEIRKELEKLER